MDSSAVNAEIYDQGAELDLLAAVASEMDDRSVVDVGSESGAVAAVLRAAGFGPMWLLEPFPPSVARLRERFGADNQVSVLEVAAGTHDGRADLHLAEDRSGAELDAYHALRPSRPGADVVWERSLEVALRSLDSLSAAGEIPKRLGLLKIDAEGSDADVLRGASGLSSEIVMVEFWRDLPGTVGPCPYTLEELRPLVEALGPRRFLFVRHGRRHVSIGRWDSADPAPGEWGNLVFVSDGLVAATEAALPALERALADRTERITEEQERAAAERLDLINELTRTATSRGAE